MWQEKIYKQNLQLSPLGGIRIACFLKDGIGVLSSKRVLPHYTLVYVVRGQGSYRDANGVSRKVTAGDAILVFPGLEHWYGPAKGDTWDEFYLVFEGPVFDMWRDSGCFDRNKPVINLNPMDFWRERILSLIGSGQARTEEDYLREAIRVQELLAEIQEAGRRDLEKDIRWLADAKAALETHADAKDAASAMRERYEAFRKKFRRLSGVSPGKYRSSLIMERACDLLAHDNLKMREIAAQLGFCDEYHFSRQFSKKVGWSPSEFRARIRQNPVSLDDLGQIG
ncbi:helix-turn-helix domain-containing protein [Erythrobacter sp. W53]|uniref:helix-turn-helix domain-containing protein n=1 Tax=Erythrobacteraceae TaxID=335929 RepID=UPI0036D37696